MSELVRWACEMSGRAVWRVLNSKWAARCTDEGCGKVSGTREWDTTVASTYRLMLQTTLTLNGRTTLGWGKCGY